MAVAISMSLGILLAILITRAMQELMTCLSSSIMLRGDKQWSRLLGTTADDYAEGVTVDGSGNLYVAGYSSGNFDNKSNAGSYDMFVVKYNAQGDKQWSRLLGSTDYDVARGVTVDGSGNLYVAGYSYGNFDNKSNAGDIDMFVVKYNAQGDKQGSRLLGFYC